MDFAYRDTSTERDWTEWHGRNVSLENGGVEIASESLQSFVSPRPLLPDTLSGIVDIDIDACGLCYILDTDGGLHRYDREHDRLDRLECVAVESGTPVAVAVTADSIYVATTTGIRALSRTLHQRRWDLAEGVESPVAMTHQGDAVYLLDAGGMDESGQIRRVHRDARTSTRVDGLDDPVDVAFDTAGTAYVLDNLLEGEATDTGSDAATFAVKRFDETVLGSVADNAPADPIWVSPRAFRTAGGEQRVEPVAIAAAGPGELVAGLSPTPAGSERTRFLLRYLPDSGAFERQVSFRRGCDVLQYHEHDDGRRLYAYAGARGGTDRAMYVLDGVNHRLRNPETGGFDAQLVRRVDSGVTDVQWHRVTSSLDVSTPGTQVQLSYAATDDDTVIPPALASDEPIPDLEAVDGIGPTYADRLRQVGISDVAALADRDPRDIAAIVSVETFDISAETTRDWRTDAANIAETQGGDTDVEAVTGIGPTYGRRLRDGGIETVGDLAETPVDVVAALASKRVVDVSTERAARWRDEAEALTPLQPTGTFEWTPLGRPNPSDALVEDANGRYLWVKLELVGTEDASPRVESFRAYLPRQSYLRYLPDLYQEDPAAAAFLERFLSLFESVNTDIEQAIAALTRYLDVDGVPAEYLGWLADWLALEADENWPTAARRQLLNDASTLYKQRGTRRGLKHVLERYLDAVADPSDAWVETIDRQAAAITSRETADGLGRGASAQMADAAGRESELALLDQTAFVLEHSDLDCIEDDAVRASYETLISCPQCFLVLVRPWVSDDAHQTVERIVDSQRPAHTVGRAVHLQPWAQLTDGRDDPVRGHHAYLGVNTLLPDREFVLEESILGTDSTLGDHEFDGQYDIHARLGTDTFMS